MEIVRILVSLGLVTISAFGFVGALKGRDRVLIGAAALSLAAAGILSFLVLHAPSATTDAEPGSETAPASDGIGDEDE
jgi:hypothetical protein